MNLSDLERGDSVHIDHDADSGWPQTYEVMDTETEDIGLAEIVVVALVAGCDRYTLRQVGDNVPSINHEDGEEMEVAADDISTFDSAADISYD